MPDLEADLIKAEAAQNRAAASSVVNRMIAILHGKLPAIPCHHAMKAVVQSLGEETMFRALFHLAGKAAMDALVPPAPPQFSPGIGSGMLMMSGGNFNHEIIKQLISQQTGIPMEDLKIQGEDNQDECSDPNCPNCGPASSDNGTSLSA